MSTSLRIALVLLLSSLAPLGLQASVEPAASSAQLRPTAEHAQAALWTHRMISSFHLRSRPLDDALSSEIFDRYLDALDPDRSFLLASDIEDFERWRYRLDDALLEQDLTPAFEMFNVYLQRVRERSAHAEALLEGGFRFDVDEYIDLDPERRTWAADRAALDEQWRLRVKNDWLRLRLAGRDDEAIRTTLRQRYLNYARRVGELKADEVFQTFMNAYAGSIEPHTSYMGPRASENFQISMRLSLEGIGAVLQRDANDHTVVRSIVPGGPAALQGQLREGDRILAVGQGTDGPMVDVVGWRLDDVVDLIRGPKDSTVRLEILPADAGLDGEPVQLAIVRQRVRLEEQAARRSVLEIGEGPERRRIGVIQLPTFYMDFEARRRGDPDYRSTTRDVRRLLAELTEEGIDGLIVDLRNNGGGSLAEATELTGLFIESGPVVQVRDSRGVQIERDPNPAVAWDGPMAVLVNRHSASASEIFAAAMQDYGRALIIGEPTFGKGTVQNLMDLDAITRSERPRFGQLKLTVAQFYRVNGESTQHRGVVPDLQFPSPVDPSEHGESSFDNALPHTTISPARFTPWSELASLVPALKTRHELRVRNDPEFRFFVEDIEQMREARQRTRFSLLESERRREREAEEARRQARLEARRALGLDADAATAAASDDGLEPGEGALTSGAPSGADGPGSSAGAARDVLLTETARILGDALHLLQDARMAATQQAAAGRRVN